MSDNIREALGDVPLPPELSKRSLLGIERALGERRRVRARRWAVSAAAAVILGAALLSLSPSGGRVWAELRRALPFVPGIGMLDDRYEQGAGEERLVLQEPIRLKLGGGEFVITGMTVDDQMTYITFEEKNAIVPKSVRITNERGESFDVPVSMSVGSIDERSGSYWHKGKLDIGRSSKLVFDAYPDTVVPLKLAPAPNYDSYEEMGPTESAGGVSITAVPARVGDRARITLVSPSSKDYRIDTYTIDGAVRPGRQITITDDTGKPLAIEPESGVAAPLSTFYFPLTDSNWAYRMTIPEIEVTYSRAKTRLSFPVPAEGSVDVGRTVLLAGFPITVTRVERIDSTGLRVYVDLHFDENAEHSLRDFSLDGESSMMKMNESTWATEFFQFAIEPDDKRAQVTLTDAHVIVRGPWTFTFRPENFSEAPSSP